MKVFKQVYTKLLEGLDSISSETNLRKWKWLVIGIFKPTQSCGKMFIEKLSNQLNDLNTSYDSISLLDDFNMATGYLKLQHFCGTYDLKKLIKEPTGFNGINPTYIDLNLTSKSSFL